MSVHEEVTKLMIQTPYGALTMSFEVYQTFSKTPELLQWIHLAKMAKRGEHAKAKAMQWYWTTRASLEYKRMN